MSRAAVAAGTILLVVLMFSLSGCASNSDGAKESTESIEASESAGQRMAGAPKKVVIPREVFEDKPEAPVLTSPESAVRSYLEWVSFAYRTTESAAATHTMSAQQEVFVDSYVQFNLQESRRIDQALDAITFGKASIGARKATLPAREKWTYRYVSISDPSKTLAGPYPASYETTYTLIKKDTGDWVVDSVDVSTIGDVK